VHYKEGPEGYCPACNRIVACRWAPSTLGAVLLGKKPPTGMLVLVAHSLMKADCKGSDQPAQDVPDEPDTYEARFTYEAKKPGPETYVNSYRKYVN
jgi:hypothetical protein